MNKFIPALLILSYASFGQPTLETIIQKGHELAVMSVAVSPDSNFVLTGSKDKSIKLWEIATGREVRNFLGHEMTVTSLDFSSDGNLVVSGSYDKTIKIWEVATGKQLTSINTDDLITSVAFDPKSKFIAAAGYNRSGYQDSATIYDLKTFKKIVRLPVNADEGLGLGVSIAISPDGTWIGFGEDNRQVSLYRCFTWEKKYTFTFEQGSCGGCATQLTFSPDSRYLYMGSHDGPLKKYDLADGKLLKVYEEKCEDLTAIALSNDGLMVAISTEKEVKVWDEQSGGLLTSVRAGDRGDFHAIAFSRNNERLFITSDNNTAFAWNIKQRKRELVLTGFLNTRDYGGLNYDPNFYWESAIAKYVRLKNSLLITRDGKTLIKGKFGTKVKQWDIASGKVVMDFVGHKRAVLCYDLSKDGQKLLTGGGDGKIMLWDLKTGDSLQVIRSYREPIFDIHFNSNETQIVSCSWDASMKIHDLKSGSLITHVDFESYAAYNVQFDPHDLYVVTARLDNSLQLWETDTRSVVRTFTGHTGIVSTIQFSGDGKTLLSASWDGSIRLWDVGTGLMTKKLKNLRGAVYAAVFSPDGRYVYAAGADRIISVWELSSSTVIRTFPGHQAEITSIVFSPDNKMLISHSVDGATKFWDLSSGKEFFEHIHLGENDWMVKNPEGYFNATDDARKYIHFVSGLKTFSVDQFFNDFYRPDLLPRIFQERGGNENLKGVQGKLKNSPPPGIKIAVAPAVGNQAEVFVRIIDNGGGATSLKLFHNGKNIPVISETLSLPAGKGEMTTYKHMIDLIGGTNIFTATASNRDNIESDPQSVEIFSDNASKSSTCYILSVGINQYKNQRLSLNYAKPDAESFGKIMDEKGANLFKSMKLISIYDTEATRENILKKLDDLAGEIHQEDVFIFYYAGHGTMVDNQFYFIPSESSRLYDAPSLNREAIQASVIQEKFKHIKALKQLIVMDACQSGGSVELLATRGASEEKAIAQLSRSAGIHVIASAGSEQLATEFGELGHGLFTYVLIKGLQGDADGAPKDGKVTIYELKSYIDDQVPEMTRKLKGRPQYPYTFSRGQDFPVAIE